MLADQFVEAAEAAPHSRALDEVARLLWRAHAEGKMDDAAAAAVSEAIAGRRRAFAAGQGFARPSPQRAASGLRRAARRPRSPDRQASLERRRRQAASGAVPAKIAASFTPAEIAVLTVIGRQCQGSGVCVLPIDAIAALAGCCRTSVQNALRQARGLGLILVKERRIPGQKSLTNVIRIISPEWRNWLERGGRGIGFRKLNPTNTIFSPRGAERSNFAPKSTRREAPATSRLHTRL
jgi:hypothetical protein